MYKILIFSLKMEADWSVETPEYYYITALSHNTEDYGFQIKRTQFPYLGQFLIPLLSFLAWLKL